MANTDPVSIDGSHPAKALSKDDLHGIIIFLAKIFSKCDVRGLKKESQNRMKTQVCLLIPPLNKNTNYTMGIVPYITRNLQEAYRNVKNNACVLLKPPKL